MGNVKSAARLARDTVFRTNRQSRRHDGEFGHPRSAVMCTAELSNGSAEIELFLQQGGPVFAKPGSLPHAKREKTSIQFVRCIARYKPAVLTCRSASTIGSRQVCSAGQYREIQGSIFNLQSYVSTYRLAASFSRLALPETRRIVHRSIQHLKILRSLSLMPSNILRY